MFHLTIYRLSVPNSPSFALLCNAEAGSWRPNSIPGNFDKTPVGKFQASLLASQWAVFCGPPSGVLRGIKRW